MQWKDYAFGIWPASIVARLQLSTIEFLCALASFALRFELLLCERLANSAAKHRERSDYKPGKNVVKSPTRFDAAFFKRFYFDRETRVTTREEMRARAELIAAILRHAQLPVRSILDAGCGIGLLKPAFARALKQARYVGLEASDYLCRRYGWTRGSIVDYRPAAPFDLVVCYDVLQYLDDRAAARALANLGRLSRVALYFSALTLEDWRRNCDRSRTDRDVNMRRTAWYRARLQRNFYYYGLGVWIRRTQYAQRWALET